MGRFGIAISLLVCALGSAPHARALSECTEPLLSTAYDVRGERPFFTAPTADALALAVNALGDEEPPWCVSPEDPRCSPLPGHSAPRELAVRAFSAPSVQPELPAPPDAHAVACSSASGLVPARGVHHRLERPPRAARRAF